MKQLFGSTGIRGLVFGPLVGPSGLNLDVALVTRLGKIWASYNNYPKKILMAKDPRNSSDMIFSALAAGITSCGVKVVDCGNAPTPALNYMCKKVGLPGIMITGSHTPPDMNAMKFILPSGAEIDWESGEREVEKMFFDGNAEFRQEAIKCGTIEKMDITKTYFEYLNEKLDIDLSGLKIVVDPGNGCMSGIMSEFFRKRGALVEAINDKMDSMFSGRGPEPLLPSSMEMLCKAVLEHQADLGIGFDGDGDRAIFVDDKGNHIWGDYSFALMAKSLVNKGESIATPVSTMGIIDDVAVEKGFNVVYTKVGASEVARVCLENGFDIGGEQNGGIIFAKDNPCRDGGRAAIEMLKIVKGDSLYRIISEMPKYHIMKEKIKHPVSMYNSRMELLTKVKEAFSEKIIKDIDGVKVLMDEESNTWSLMRFSSTEPLFRIFTGGKDDTVVEKEHLNAVGTVRNILGEGGTK